MQLVEQHVIHKGDSRYTVIDRAAFASKNLWNLANYKRERGRFLCDPLPFFGRTKEKRFV